uniref:TonB-dependent receptor domain-containing protein n=1 Tax=Castellaniella defragrans TaxID=75697 RepID=UPI0033420DC1
MTSLHSRRLLAALCTLPLAATAQTSQPSAANSGVPALPDIVVTASRSPEPLADAIGDITVIGQDQLAQARGDSIAEIIARQPGVQFATNGGPQTATSLFLRGASSTHTLVLIDGMRINGSTSGGTNFPAIDPAMVERIEILRGSASSLYGSDAIGGVVNIITKKGEQDRPLSAWANVGYGTYDTFKSSLGLSGAAQGWDYSLSASKAHSEGFDSQRPSYANGTPNTFHAPGKDGYRSHAISGTLGYRWAEGHRIGLSAYNSQIRGVYDNGVTDPDAHTFYRQQAYSLNSIDRITDWWNSELRFGFTKDGYDDRSSYPGVFNSIKRHYSWMNTLTPLKDQRVSLLFERQEERIQSTTAYDRTRREADAVALIYAGTFDRLHTQASIRNDKYTDYGHKTTGSLGMDFDLTDTWQIGIAGNTGFRAPTFNELYWPLEWGFKGNPDLNPERSRNIEAHVQYRTPETQLSLIVYRNRVDDLINGYVCDAMYNCTTENVDQATLRGLTLTGEHRFDATTLYASADFLDPSNDDPKTGEGSQLPLRARQVFHLGVEHRIQALKLGAEYQYTGNRYANTANSVRLGGFSLVNLTAAYDFSKSLGLQVRWNNVLDKDYVLVDGYNTPGSNVFVNVSWRM